MISEYKEALWLISHKYDGAKKNMWKFLRRRMNKKTHHEIVAKLNKQRVCRHTVALPFTLKKYYGNSNVSPCKTIIFKKSSLKEPKSFKIL